MADNNTYDFQAITEAEYLSAKANATICLEMIQSCRIVADAYDPRNLGINAMVNSLCAAAYGWCYLNVEAAYLASGVISLLKSTSYLLTSILARCL